MLDLDRDVATPQQDANQLSLVLGDGEIAENIGAADGSRRPEVARS